MSHEAFLKAIADSPDDDLPRLVYADYLQETGDEAHAELIRVQCELARISEADPNRNRLEDREHELLNEHEPRLMGNLDQFDREGIREWKFRRGFLSEITTNAADLITLGHQLMQRHPITAWTYQPGVRTDWADPAAIASSSAVARLCSIDLSASGYPTRHFEGFLTHPKFPPITDLNLTNCSGFDDVLDILERSPVVDSLKTISVGGRTRFDGTWGGNPNDELEVGRLVQCLSYSRLERLHLHDCNLPAFDLGRILTARFTEHLTDLDISSNPIAPDHWRTFQRANPTLRLNHLDVSGTPLAGVSLDRLLEVPALSELTELGFNGCGSARKNVDVLAHSAFWANAKRLWANGGTIPASTLEPLCQNAGPKELRVLDLSNNFLRAEGVRMIAESAWAKALTWLGLSNNYLDDHATEILANSEAFRELRTLHMTSNPFRHEDNTVGVSNLAAQHLATTPSLANLQVLNVGHTGINDRGAARLIDGDCWRLSGLGLAGLNLTDYAVDALAQSPKLARLQWLDLSENTRLGGATLRALAESPYLSRLCELDVHGIPIYEAIRYALRERLGHRLSE